jgi:PGF-CTERM protein
MVLSVFAGTVAFAGGAAAANQSSTDASALGDGVRAQQQDTTPPRFQSATHYDPDGNGGTAPIVEVAFNEDIDSSTLDNMTLYVDDEEVPASAYGNITETDPGRVEIQGLNELYTEDVTLNIPSSVTDAAGNSVRPNELDDDRNVSVTTATVTVTPGASSVDDPRRVYQGENVVLKNETAGLNSDIDIEGEDTDYTFSGSTGTNSEVFVFNTSDRDATQYNFSIGNVAEPNAAIDVTDLGFNVTADDLNVTNEDTIEGTVSANAGNRNIEVTLYDDDDDEVTSVGATLSGQGEYDYEFNLSSADDGDKVSAGDYYVEARDNASGVTDETDTIVVTKAGEGQGGFNQSVVTDQRGDVVNITVGMENTDQATLTIGDEDDGFLANVTVTDDDDDGQVVVQFNTWAARGASGSLSSNNDVFDVADSDDELDSARINPDYSVDNLLDAGDYSLEVRSGDDETEDSQNVATLVLEERQTESLQSWTAPSGEDLGDKGEVYDAIENGNLTQTSNVANGDIAVHQLSASGLEGILDAQGEDDVASQFFAEGNFGPGDEFVLTVNQSDPGANREAFGLVLNESNTDVIADSENDSYFIVYDTDSNNLAAVRDTNDDNVYNTSDSQWVDIEDDDSFTSNFTVYEDDDGLADSEQTVKGNYTLVEAEYDMDDPYNVSAASNQTVSGTTSLAPGTEVQLRLRSSGDTQPSFLKTATTYVTENQTFSAEFDFSEQSAGDEYTLTVSGGPADDLEVDGNVVEATQTETETETGTATETETETGTATETATETDTATETATETTTQAGGNGGGGDGTQTQTSTPGFGVVVAVTALLAAALLAVRRDN